MEVYTGAWNGDVPEELSVSVIGSKGFTNHGRCESFAKKLVKHLSAKEYDVVVGFNKMPGLDVYFSADSCFAAKSIEKSVWYRLTGRCHSYLRLEKAVFHKTSQTEIMLLSEREKMFFVDYYGTAERRFHLLPPGISRDRLVGENASEIRFELRRELAIGPGQMVILMVGSGFRTKGVDRAIRALSSLPRELAEKTILLLVGNDKARPFQRLADQLGVGGKIMFMGGRDDVPRFLMASDILLHPAYREAAGMVLIEAMAAGLPVLATDVCGYGFHVQRANAGKLIPSPFQQETLNRLLASMLTSGEASNWRNNGRKYVATTDVFSLPEKAADIIEQVAAC